MSSIVADCPRCKASLITFDVVDSVRVGTGHVDWQYRYETFCNCRRCRKSTIFLLEVKDYGLHKIFNSPDTLKTRGNLEDSFHNLGYVSLKDFATHTSPEFVPENIRSIFNEGATCLAVKCFNAAATMFRLCLDLATRPLLPADDDGGEKPNSRQRRDLGLRIPWLIEHGHLPKDLTPFATTVREDGNDGADSGDLTEHDAADLLDFCSLLLERIYTEPGRLRVAEERRSARRASRSSN